MSGASKCLVNPVALKACLARSGDVAARLLDISCVRMVTEHTSAWGQSTSPASLDLTLELGTYQFRVGASVQAKGKTWMRLSLDSLVPSARAHLKSFLSPKKIGESLTEDGRTKDSRHFHGLNESELWFHDSGALLFSYLDRKNTESQFVIHIPAPRLPLSVGTMPRSQYIDLNRVDEELPLTPLTENEVYVRVGECRDIVTNFRPAESKEFQIKQHLLSVISDYLYSRRRGVDRTLGA